MSPATARRVKSCTERERSAGEFTVGNEANEGRRRAQQSGGDEFGLDAEGAEAEERTERVGVRRSECITARNAGSAEIEGIGGFTTEDPEGTEDGEGG